MSDSTCSIPGCDGKYNAHGLCGMHYSRQKRHGDPLWEPVVPSGSRPKVCTIEDCDNPHYARKYCGAHYQRWKKYGDPIGTYQPKSTRTCSAESCDRPVKHREWCGKHYQQWLKYGDPLADHRQRHRDMPCSVDGCLKLMLAMGLCAGHYTRSRSGNPLNERPLRDYFITDDLAERLAHYAPPGEPDECWEWRGSTNKGYGVFTVHGSRVRVAHDVAWEIHHCRPLPKGMLIRHHCDNPPCCNPAHLELGTHADNSADKVSRGRQAKGSRHGIAVLTDDDVRAIRAMCAAGQYQRVVGEHFGIRQNHVSLIVNRIIWSHVE